MLRDIQGQLNKMEKVTFDDMKDYFQIGDIYVDGFGHPTLCTEIEIYHEDKDICLEGISLFDGSYPRGCSVMHTCPEKISLDEAWKMKLDYEKSKNPRCTKH